MNNQFSKQYRKLKVEYKNEGNLIGFEKREIKYEIESTHKF